MNIAYLDIETTGLDPAKHEILEVAVIKDEVAWLPLHFSLRIDEQRADAKALDINSYHERQDELADIRWLDEDAARLLVEYLDGRLVVGNNIHFDLNFVQRFLEDAGAGSTQPWYYAPLDLKAFAAGMAGLTKPASTKFIAELADVPLPDDAHTALADAYWNMHVFRSLTGNRTVDA